MSFTTISQTLKPRIRPEGKDTLFCFTLPQSKIIAKHMENARYCDSILKKTECEVEFLNQLQSIKDSSISTLTMKAGNRQSLIANQEKQITNLNTELIKTQKDVRRARWQKRLFAAGIIVLTTLTVLK